MNRPAHEISHSRSSGVMRRRRACVMDALECRLLLSSPATLLLAPFAGDTANINVSFKSAVQAQDTIFLTGFRDGDREKLWAAPAAGTSTLPVPIFISNASPGSDPSMGISAQVVYHNKFYFIANAIEGSAAGDGLFTSDGTAAGTVPVSILRSGANVLPTSLFVMNDKMYFLFNSGNAWDLWSSDGTSNGTVQVWSGPTGQNISSPSPVINGTHVLFGGGGKIYRSDGTTAGTTLVTSEAGDSTNLPDTYVIAGSKVFFLANRSSGIASLWCCNTDGTNFTPVTVPYGGLGSPGIFNKNLIGVGNHLLFTSDPNSNWPTQLWSTDGTTAGTVLLAGGANGQSVDSISTVVVAAPGTAVYGVTSIDGNRAGTWRTDGTLAGTTKFGQGGAQRWFSGANRALSSSPTTNGGLIYSQSDGTAAGTRRIEFVRADPSVFGETYIGSTGGRVIAAGYRDGYPSVWSLDMDTPTGTLAGAAFIDINRNGTREAFESAVAGTAYLDINENGQLDPGEARTTINSFNAGYAFLNLPSDRYVVRFKPNSAGVTLNAPSSGAYTIDLTANANITALNFMSRPAGSVVWGIVFGDTNRNGVQDPSESGSTGETVFLDLNGDGLANGEPTTTTSSDGSYGFLGAPVGSYPVRVLLKSGWINTTLDNAAVTVKPGNVSAAAAMGIAIAPGGHLDGSIWIDWNADGVLDSGDIPNLFSRAYVDLDNNGIWNGSEPSALTYNNGVYHIVDVVPGNHTVRLYISSSSTTQQTAPAPGTGYAVNVAIGATTLVPPFLWFNPNIVAPTGRLSGRVWSDTNGNGAVDAGEQPAWGRTVWIDADGDGLLGSFDRRAVTDISGAYSFSNSIDGDYTIRLALPKGWTQTSPTPGTAIYSTLQDGQQTVLPDFLAHSTDATAPAITSTTFAINPATGLLGMNVTFNENVVATLAASDVDLINLGDAGGSMSGAIGSIAYDANSNTASFTFAGTLADGYYLAQLVAGGYRDEAGNAGANGVARRFIWAHGGSGADAYRLIRNASGANLELHIGPTTLIAAPIASLDCLAISSGGGSDTIELDLQNGSPLPGGGAIIDASSGTDALIMLGSTSVDSAAVNVSSITLNALSLSYRSIEALSFDGRGAFDQLSIGARATVSFPSIQRFENFSNAGNASLAPNLANGLGLIVRALTLTGTLDLNNNDLILDYEGASSLSTVQTMINSARAGLWTGTGITSTAAKNTNPRNTTLGAMEASDWRLLPGNAKALFDNESVDSTAVLVKYTYYGDTNFDGRVNFDDYTRIDRGFNQRLTGWINGDFDGNGLINFDDYTLIDLAFNTQGARQRPAPPPGGVVRGG